MFSKDLKNRQPLATKFFAAALNPQNRKLHHAYMLTGCDTNAQYDLALNIAKILNCQKPENRNYEERCDCVNCSWIEQKTHPAIITISPIDYLYGNDKEQAKTVITIAQSRYLKQALSKASQYYRVIIFTNAQENSTTGWEPLPLTRKILHSEPANALLKSIEEPSGNIIFFFLTKDREDMLETIVSRTQVIPVQSNFVKAPDLTYLKKFIDNFPPKDYEKVMECSEMLIETAKENDISEEEVLNMLQEYMRQLLRQNIDNKIVSAKIIQHIKKIQDAQYKLKSSVGAQSVFDSLVAALK